MSCYFALLNCSIKVFVDRIYPARKYALKTRFRGQFVRHGSELCTRAIYNDFYQDILLDSLLVTDRVTAKCLQPMLSDVFISNQSVF